MEALKTFKKLLPAGAAYLTMAKFDFLFDDILYPAVMLWLGNMAGGIVMMLLATIINVALIKWYDKSHIDWFLIESVKEMQGGENSDGSMVKRLVTKSLRKGKVFGFIVLAWYDPMLATIFLRKTNQFHMTKKDWWVFVLATSISNVVHILVFSALLEPLRRIF